MTSLEIIIQKILGDWHRELVAEGEAEGDFEAFVVAHYMDIVKMLRAAVVDDMLQIQDTSDMALLDLTTNPMLFLAKYAEGRYD